MLLLPLAVFGPALAWPLLGWTAGSSGRVRLLGLLGPLLSAACVARLIQTLPQAAPPSWSLDWVPTMGLSLSLRADGLALFFGAIVAGMGVLVAHYAWYYFEGRLPELRRFYLLLSCFLAAMQGVVFSGNVLAMFMFWELTGVASFLLIGFHHEKEASRVGARDALLVSSATGLCLLAGALLAGHAAGSFEFADWGAGLPLGERSTWLSAALGLMLVGAFGKSAQFPLQFWLPGAMAAPTPVSAYLHSAAMVKLGIFLCARLFPFFASLDLWAPMLTITGYGTFALCAVLALLSHDLKAILAYSTVSQLGFLVGYYGLGGAPGVDYDYLHILNHVLYKGSLFLIAGVVIHATGRRDVRELGGLLRRMPLTGAACLAALAAMAGLPGTTGFLSKELMFQELLFAEPAHPGLRAFAGGAALLASIAKVAFSLRLAAVFLGPAPEGLDENFHAPPVAFQFPAALPAAAAVVLGLFPGVAESLLRLLSVPGLHAPNPAPLHAWPGATPELLVSAAVVAAGAGLYALGRRRWWPRLEIPSVLRFERGFARGLEAALRASARVTALLRSDKQAEHLPIVALFFAVTLCAALARGGLFDPAALAEGLRAYPLNAARSVTAVLIAASAFGAVFLKEWTARLIALSSSGFLMTLYFALYRGPDLAMTQLLVESAMLAVILLVFSRFPRAALEVAAVPLPPARRAAAAATAGLLGAGLTVLLLSVGRPPTAEPIGSFFARGTIELAGGANAVNTILVDFRALDTLGEIAVLLAAMLGGLGMLMHRKRRPEEYLRGPLGAPGYGIDYPEERPRD